MLLSFFLLQGIVRSYVSPAGVPMGPLRVWAPGKGMPGLRMTRAFGDFNSTNIGVVDKPEITSHVITRQDRWGGGTAVRGGEGGCNRRVRC